MVALPQTYKTADIMTTPNTNVCVPDGTYIGLIVSGEMSKSPYGQGKPDDLLLKVLITQGEYKETIIEHRLGILDETPIKSDNPTFTWSRAAYGTLGQIANAFGMADTPKDTAEICNKPIAFTTATREGKDKETGARKKEWDSSYIKSYSAVPASGVTPQVSAPAPTQPVAPATVTPPTSNPFAS